MKEILPAKLTMGRVRVRKGENRQDQRNATYVVMGPQKRELLVIISDKAGWDHCRISVNLSRKQEATNEEIMYIRELIFKPDEVVVEFHNMREGYINDDTVTTHLWRNQGEVIAVPPVEIL